MFVMDVPPDVPPQYAPVVIAQAPQAQKGNAKTDRTIGVCHLIENTKNTTRLTAINAVTPVDAVWTYLQRQEQAAFDESDYRAAKMTLLEASKQGELKLFEEMKGGGYTPSDPNYTGPDRATFLVEIGGYKVKVIYLFNVLPVVPGGKDAPYEDPKYCPNGRVWRISLNPDDPNSPFFTVEHPYLWTTPLAYTIQASLSVADLSNGALGQTTGSTPSPSTTTQPVTAGLLTRPLGRTKSTSPPTTRTSGWPRRAARVGPISKA